MSATGERLRSRETLQKAFNATKPGFNLVNLSLTVCNQEGRKKAFVSALDGNEGEGR